MPTPLERIEFPEVFYGIVAPVGTDIKPSIEELRRKLRDLDYEVVEVKVTAGFDRFKRKFKPHLGLQQKPYDQRILTHIAYGNQLRRNFKSYALMAEYAIFQIAAERQKIIESKKDYSIEKTAYVIHQFKREEEIELLRSIYGDLFTQISIYSSRETRIDHLSRLIARDHRSSDLKSHRPSAEALVNQDQNEANEQYGQRVSKIFHEADFVINSDVIKPSIDLQISRFLEIQFSSNKHSPTKFEYGVFLAKSAALRSLDLSRQVGAAIFTPLGEILSLGSNEVPKARGGTYWSDDEFDDREYKRGVDTNEKRKKRL